MSMVVYIITLYLHFFLHTSFMPLPPRNSQVSFLFPVFISVSYEDFAHCHMGRKWGLCFRSGPLRLCGAQLS